MVGSGQVVAVACLKGGRSDDDECTKKRTQLHVVKRGVGEGGEGYWPSDIPCCYGNSGGEVRWQGALVTLCCCCPSFLVES